MGSDGTTDPLFHHWEETNSTLRPSIYHATQTAAANAPAPYVAPAIDAMDVTLDLTKYHVNLGHKEGVGARTSKKLKGWIYMNGCFPENYHAWDSPLIATSYKSGISQCEPGCHICIDKTLTRIVAPQIVANNTCKDTVTNVIALLDFDSLKNGMIVDIDHTDNDNDLQMGDDPFPKGHPLQFDILQAAINYDDNEPFYIPERGVMFMGNRFARTDVSAGLNKRWGLEHQSYFTMQAWVRFDNDNLLDFASSPLPMGQVFHKINLAPPAITPIGYGIDASRTVVRFWHENKYREYDITAQIAANQDEWHSFSATLMRFDRSSKT
jgi:hypothetical protein